ncbi:hypothetical protein BKA56DRAFT_660437 [Ilyonectria sp. MPI-CAGE-AT-0026]|nr:hypothetical protein BKA56DRAFT_660437 [Ilyonectria sp. MPI-CAGE-AT-0026]
MALSLAASALGKLASLREMLELTRRRRDSPSKNVSVFFNNHHFVSQTCGHLSDVDRAALALSCQQALSMAGRGVLRLHVGDKFLLLQRLERDGYLMEEGEILCPHWTGSDARRKIYFRGRASVIHDQLIVESNINLYGRHSKVIVPLLTKFLKNNHDLMHICQHHKWEHFLEGSEPNTDRDVVTRFAHDCVLRPKQEEEKPRGIASPPNDATTRNKGTLCDDCCTAFTISCCKREGQDYAMILSSWKNYGYGRDLDDPMWLSHTNTITEHNSRRYIPEVSAFEGTHFALRDKYCPYQYLREPNPTRVTRLVTYNMAKYESKKLLYEIGWMQLAFLNPVTGNLDD